MVDGSKANPGTADATKLVAWKQKDVKAKSSLILHCDNREIQFVWSLSTSNDIWEKLKIYSHTNLAS